MSLEHRRMPRATLLRWLPQEGAPGITRYRTPGSPQSLDGIDAHADDIDQIHELASSSDTGSVLFIGHDSAPSLVLPPFAIEHASDHASAAPGTLIALLEMRRALAVFLLRKRGYSVGFFRGDALIDSKTGTRFVKNRHRKGGQSQRRFDRIREKQVHGLFGKACEVAREKLDPYRAEIQHVFLGGDRLTLLAFRKECDYFESFGSRLMPRVLHAPGDPNRAALEATPRDVWSSDVYTLTADVAPDPAT